MARSLISISACVVSGVAAWSAAAQQQTVREALASAQRPITRFSTTPSGVAPSMANVLRDTDLIVMGMIGGFTSRETSDQLDVVTDYQILQPIYLGRRPTARMPNPSSALVVTFPGGAFSVDGLTLTSKHHAMPPPEPGTWCLLLLKESREGYRLALQYFGAFAIESGLLTPLTTKKGFAPELRSAVAEEVGRQLADQLK